MNNKKPVWIAAVARGHNAGVCLLKDGEIVFSIEEERLSRTKYDGGPYASMVKILDYTDKLDYLVIAHTQNLATAGRVDYTGDDVYTGLARKLGLIERNSSKRPHPQVFDFSHIHHKLHAAAAFYRSGFEDAAAVVVDGAGTFVELGFGENPIVTWEVESVFKCSYPNEFQTIFKHLGTRENIPSIFIDKFDSSKYGEPGKTHEVLIDDRAGIVKAYEAVTQYCGFSPIEAGKTMGLFPYGNPNPGIPKIFDQEADYATTNRNLIIPTYPNAAIVNANMYGALAESGDEDVTKLQNRRDLAYAVQTQSQEQVVKLIRKAVEKTGTKNVVISGGYGLNCVANYHYLEALKDDGINLYVEPISNDAGTAIGAALLFHYASGGSRIAHRREIYLGPQQKWVESSDMEKLVAEYGGTISNGTNEDVVALLEQKNIVALFQGRSENGPRALGNRSLLFDPRFVDGKDFVNIVKRREYFRPFAGSVLEEDAHDWFDLRGMPNSPHMMYAVNCKPGVEEKIPSIIHVDGTCRIQTVSLEDNPNYYHLIKAFKEKTGVPIVFNTSFNLGGEPLVESLDDALRTLKNSKIEYLYLPEYSKLIKIANEQES
jgi:carbamoyltransferase